MARLGRLLACGLACAAAVAEGPIAFAEEKAAATPKSTPPKAASAGEDEKGLASYSPYEKTTIKAALTKLETSIDPSPAGKIVERVDVVPLEVIEERDPAPAFLNWFHSTTKPYVIRREVLLQVGERFRQDLCDESARNLSGIRQISLVVCVAAKGSRPDRVRLVMITKDVWSLRINTNFRYAGGRFEYLLVQPAEENLFGTHQAIHATFFLDLATVAIGGRYKLPRIGGSYLELATEANVIVNLDTGEPEGSAGQFSYGQPLTSTLAEWSWGAVIGWRNEILRRFCVTGATSCAGDLRGFDAKVTPEVDDAIPFSYRSDVQSGQYFATRSFGREIKHNFSAGLDVSRRVFRAGDLSGYDPAAVAEFEERVLPVSDTRVGPFLEYRTVSTRFNRVLDLETLALQEDVRSGHELILKVSPITKLLRSSRNLFHVLAAARYSLPVSDGLVSGYVESITDIQADELPDASIEVGGRVMTPRLGIGRLLVDAKVLHRYRNYLNKVSSLGGSTRLRGYPTQALLGKDFVTANFEFRTRPVEILACQLGGAFFFDAGDAFEGWEDFRPKQSVGFGLRVLFPQLDRTVMRADWGFPITKGYREPDGFPGDIVVTFKQAFPIPDVPSRGGGTE
jgi:hypothetical protein